jgi:hypothetical protein
LTFWWDRRSEIQLSQSSREWKFKSDNAALISCVLSIQDMITESGIPSGLEIGGGVITFCTPYILTDSRFFGCWQPLQKPASVFWHIENVDVDQACGFGEHCRTWLSDIRIWIINSAWISLWHFEQSKMIQSEKENNGTESAKILNSIDRPFLQIV